MTLWLVAAGMSMLSTPAPALEINRIVIAISIKTSACEIWLFCYFWVVINIPSDNFYTTVTSCEHFSCNFGIRSHDKGIVVLKKGNYRYGLKIGIRIYSVILSGFISKFGNFSWDFCPVYGLGYCLCKYTIFWTVIANFLEKNLHTKCRFCCFCLTNEDNFCFAVNAFTFKNKDCSRWTSCHEPLLYVMIWLPIYILNIYLADRGSKTRLFAANCDVEWITMTCCLPSDCKFGGII